jgi:hypothetical protein
VNKGQEFTITVRGEDIRVRCEGNSTYVTRRVTKERPRGILPITHEGSTRFINYLAGIAGAEYFPDPSGNKQ